MTYKRYRLLLTFCTALVLMTSLSGCGNGGNRETSSGQASQAQAETVTSAPETNAENSEESQEGSALVSLGDELYAAYPEAFPDRVYYGSEVFEKNCKKLYACEPGDLKDALIAFSRTGAVADEVSVVIPADGDPEKLTKMLEARRDMRWNDFNGYAPDELPKIEDAHIFTAGDAAVLVISDDAGDIEKLIKEKLG